MSNLSTIFLRVPKLKAIITKFDKTSQNVGLDAVGTDYIVKILKSNFSRSMDESSFTLSITVDNIYDVNGTLIRFEPMDRVKLLSGYDSETNLIPVFLGFVDSVSRDNPDKTQNLSCRDSLKLPMNSYLLQEDKIVYSAIADDDNFGGQSEANRQTEKLIQDFLVDSGIPTSFQNLATTNITIGGKAGTDVPNKPAEFVYETRMDGVNRLVSAINYRFWNDSLGICQLKRVRPFGSNTYAHEYATAVESLDNPWWDSGNTDGGNLVMTTSGNLCQILSTNESDESLRNYVTVSGENNLSLTLSALSNFVPSPPTYRKVEIRSNLYDTQHMVNTVASGIFEELNRLQRSATIQIEADTSVHLGQTVKVTDSYAVGSAPINYFIQGYNTTYDNGGFKQTLDLIGGLGAGDIAASGQIPVASYSYDLISTTLNGTEYATISVDARASYDFDGDIRYYQWTLSGESAVRGLYRSFTSSTLTDTSLAVEVEDNDAYTDGLTIVHSRGSNNLVQRSVYFASDKSVYGTLDGGANWNSEDFQAILSIVNEQEGSGVSVSVGTSKLSQSFTPVRNTLLINVDFKMLSSSFVGNLVLYAADGSGHPTGSALTTIVMTGISTSSAWNRFTINYNFISGTEYCLVVERTSGNATIRFKGGASVTRFDTMSTWNGSWNNTAGVVTMRINAPDYTSSVSVDAKVKEKAYVAAGNELWYTNDAGVTWANAHTFSTSASASWVYDTITSVYVDRRANFADRPNSAVIWFGTDKGNLYSSIDSGVNFYLVSGFADSISRITSSITDGALFVTMGNTLRKTENYGDSFSTVYTAGSDITGVAVEGNFIHLTTSSGIHRSENYGDTFVNGLIGEESITVGEGAIERSISGWNTNTIINVNTPADNSGRITEVTMFIGNVPSGDVVLGTFKQNNDTATKFTAVDYQTVNVSEGLNTIVTDISIGVGEYIGVYLNDSKLYYDNSGGYSPGGIYSKAGDFDRTSEQSYATNGAYIASIKGTGSGLTVGDIAIGAKNEQDSIMVRDGAVHHNLSNILWLKLDEPTDFSLKDYTFRNKGTITDCLWTTGYDGGNALAFNGVSSKVTIPDKTILRMNHAFTLNILVRPTTGGNGSQEYLLFKGASDDSFVNYSISIGSGDTLDFEVNWFRSSDGAYPRAKATTAYVPDSEWHLITVTYDNRKITLYLDGITKHAVTVGGGLYFGTGSQDLYIGARSDGSLWFTGYIDSLKFIKGAFSGTDVAQYWAKLQLGQEDELYFYTPAAGLRGTAKCVVTDPQFYGIAYFGTTSGMFATFDNGDNIFLMSDNQANDISIGHYSAKSLP